MFNLLIASEQEKHYEKYKSISILESQLISLLCRLMFHDPLSEELYMWTFNTCTMLLGESNVYLELNDNRSCIQSDYCGSSKIKIL